MNQVEQNYSNLKSYSEKIIPALDDYKKSYVNYNVNPQNQEYATIFSINSGNITGLNKDLFVTINTIQKSTDDLNKKINILDNNLILEKKTNSDLVFKIQQIKGTGVGSKIMNSNSKELYKQQYISNWDMVFGILIISGMLVTIFRKPVTSQV
jgi:hypothetical protein